jgi:hypothetical protein
VNVASHSHKVLFRLYENCSIAATKQWPVSAVRPVKSLRVDPIEMSHRSRKGCVGCLNQEVIVIVHETVRIDPHSPHLAGLAKQIQKTLPILIVKKDLLPGGAPIHDMVVGTRVLNPQGTGHAGNNTLPNP